MVRKSQSHAPSVKAGAGSSRHGGHAKTRDKNITWVSRDDPRRGKTDWAAVAALTDEEIEAAVRKDPDAVPLDFDWSEAVLVMPPKKKAISIRVDEDVLDFFRQEGVGYQRRMNAVLRSYMQQRRKKRA
ncbi:MAG TPA: BrnA antitoxin family protein [Bradyrhizobium sp.]